MKIKVGRKEKQHNPYDPKVVTQSDIDRGLSKMFDDMNRPQKPMKFDSGNQMKFSPPQPQQQYQPHPQQMKQQPQQTQQPRAPKLSIPIPEPEPEEEQPYWTAQEWEQWALDMYRQGMRYLPEWFLEALGQ